MSTHPIARYHSFMIILHWLMGLTFIGMLCSGFALEYIDMDRALKVSLFQWHKSFGVTLLIAFFLRIAGRFSTPIPPMPASMPPQDLILARLGHYTLYILMLVMPFSGWLVVSTSSSGFPTIVFGLFEWPHIPGLAGDKPMHELAETLHSVGAIILVLTLLAHVGAVIKHAVCEKTNLLKRMWWSA